jgi:hypothetical protein
VLCATESENEPRPAQVNEQPVAGQKANKGFVVGVVELGGREKCKCKCKSECECGCGCENGGKDLLLVKIQAAAN